MNTNKVERVEPMKRCRDCRIEKPLSSYYRFRRTLFSYCKACHKVRTRRSRSDAAQRDRWKAYNRKSTLKRLYGITPLEYDAILLAQDGGCAICGETQAAGGYRLHVDHDHETREVRGLLCDSCNAGLGRFGDDAGRLRRAALYLESGRVRELLGKLENIYPLLMGAGKSTPTK